MSSIIARLKEYVGDTNKTIITKNRTQKRKSSLFPPTTLDVVNAAEEQLGFPLPNLLKDIYMQVANGGIGPGYGIYGLKGGFLRTEPHGQEDPGTTLVEEYLKHKPNGKSIAETGCNFERDGNISGGEKINGNTRML